MGILYNSVILHQEMKRQFLIERLKGKGITHSQNGMSIEQLDYEDLKYELVLQAFREIDAERDENRWF
jgi:hypothetical protein